MITKYSLFDLKYYFQKNKKIYLFFLFFFLLGIIAGIIISFTSDSYLALLTTKDKVFFDYVNGKADFGKESTKMILNFLLFQGIAFLLNLNYYSGLLGYFLISYQSSMMYLSLSALIAQHGFIGILTTLFLILPVNIVLIGTNMLFSGFCLIRSYNALKYKKFTYGFDKKFFLILLLFFVFEIVFSYLVTFLFVLVLRRRYFIIF